MKKKTFASRFEHYSDLVTKWAGSSMAFFIAVFLVVVWLLTGPVFDYSDTWQLVINTGTTIITFLMVFLIQKSQNKDSLAIQLKLNELVAANEKASNRMVDVEDMTEEELLVLHKYYQRMSQMAQKEGSLHTSHSIDKAEKVHAYKKKKGTE